MTKGFKLNWGLWMEATPYAEAKAVLPAGQRGILLEERGRLAVRVLREGTVGPRWYHRLFWHPYDEEKREEWQNAVV